MSAQLVQAQCSWCKGTGAAEQLMERTSSGDWVANTMLDHDLADAWIRADKSAPLKWEDCDCPVCAGAGSYELESSPCRIF